MPFFETSDQSPQLRLSRVSTEFKTTKLFVPWKCRDWGKSKMWGPSISSTFKFSFLDSNLQQNEESWDFLRRDLKSGRGRFVESLDKALEAINSRGLILKGCEKSPNKLFLTNML